MMTIKQIKNEALHSTTKRSQAAPTLSYGRQGSAEER